MDIKFYLPLFISFGALLFSFLNYQRTRRSENENYLYKLKTEVYSKILAEFNSLFNELEGNLSAAKSFLKNPSEKQSDEMLDNANSVDKICFEFDDFIVANSLFIPNDILYRLNSFSENILNGDSLDDEVIDTPNQINAIEKFIDKSIADANSIGELFRKDLHIESLNSSLFKRLK